MELSLYVQSGLQRTSKDRVTVVLPLFLSGPFFPKKPAEKPCPAFKDLRESLYAKDTGQFPVMGGGDRRAHIRTDLTVGTGLHL